MTEYPLISDTSAGFAACISVMFFGLLHELRKNYVISIGVEIFRHLRTQVVSSGFYVTLVKTM